MMIMPGYQEPSAASIGKRFTSKAHHKPCREHIKMNDKLHLSQTIKWPLARESNPEAVNDKMSGLFFLCRVHTVFCSGSLLRMHKSKDLQKCLSRHSMRPRFFWEVACNAAKPTEMQVDWTCTKMKLDMLNVEKGQVRRWFCTGNNF